MLYLLSYTRSLETRQIFTLFHKDLGKHLQRLQHSTSRNIFNVFASRVEKGVGERRAALATQRM